MRPGGLWQHPAFLRLWGAATVSTFGTLVTRTALPFVAILSLDASPSDLAWLRVAELLPGFVFGLVAGVWVDRLRRRPVLIGTDLGRAVLLATIPGAALVGLLGFPLLFGVAALGSVLGVAFDVAYRAYLPALIGRDDLVEGNSKLTAAAAVAVDAATFVVSACLVWRIRSPEPRPPRPERRPALATEVGEGLRLIVADPLLRALAVGTVAQNLAFGAGGAVYLLFVSQELGFGAGVLGLMFAVGGAASFAGALAAGRSASLSVGPTLIVTLALTGLGQGLTPLAVGAGLGSVALLLGQQLVADSAATVYDIRSVSLLQVLTPARLLGRVSASVRVLEIGATLLGTLLGALVGERLGLRPALVVQAGGFLLGALALARSPLRRLRQAPPAAPDLL